MKTVYETVDVVFTHKGSQRSRNFENPVEAFCSGWNRGEQLVCLVPPSLFWIMCGICISNEN